MQSQTDPFRSNLGTELTPAELQRVCGGFRPAHDVGEVITAGGNAASHAVRDQVRKVKTLAGKVIHVLDELF